jgi:vacuolar-type H+-ATPase subunit H
MMNFINKYSSIVFGLGQKYDKVSGNHTGEDIGAPIGWGSAGDTGVTGGMGTTGDITGDVNMPEDNEMGKHNYWFSWGAKPMLRTEPGWTTHVDTRPAKVEDENCARPSLLDRSEKNIRKTVNTVEDKTKHVARDAKTEGKKILSDAELKGKHAWRDIEAEAKKLKDEADLKSKKFFTEAELKSKKIMEDAERDAKKLKDEAEIKSRRLLEDGKQRMNHVEDKAKNMFERAEQSTKDFIHKTEDAGRHLLNSAERDGKAIINKAESTGRRVIDRVDRTVVHPHPDKPDTHLIYDVVSGKPTIKTQDVEFVLLHSDDI